MFFLQEIGSAAFSLCSWVQTNEGSGDREGFIRFLRCWHGSKPEHDPARHLGQQIPGEEKLHENKGSLSENRSTKKSPHCFSWKREMKLFLKLGEAPCLPVIPHL